MTICKKERGTSDKLIKAAIEKYTIHKVYSESATKGNGNFSKNSSMENTYLITQKKIPKTKFKIRNRMPVFLELGKYYKEYVCKRFFLKITLFF